MRQTICLLVLLLLAAGLFPAQAQEKTKDVTIGALGTMTLPDTWASFPTEDPNIEYMAIDMLAAVSDTKTMPPTVTVMKISGMEGMEEALTDETADALADVYVKQSSESFPGFKARQSGKTRIAGKTGIYVSGTAPVDQFGETVIDQYLIPRGNSIICFVFMYGPDTEDTSAFRAILDSFRFAP